MEVFFPSFVWVMPFFITDDVTHVSEISLIPDILSQ